MPQVRDDSDWTMLAVLTAAFLAVAIFAAVAVNFFFN